MKIGIMTGMLFAVLGWSACGQLHNGTYAPTDDPAEAEQIVSSLWEVLNSEECWESTTNYLMQYRFGDGYSYKYSGFASHSGNIYLVSAGWYGTFMAVIWETWDTELVVLIDERQFITVNQFTDVVTNYIPGTHGCF